MAKPNVKGQGMNEAITKSRRLPQVADSYRILIVEDEIEVSRLIGIALKSRGFKFKSALDGSEALQVFADFDPHMVLLDLTMPGLSGHEVYEALRCMSDVPVMVVSALVGDTDIPIPEGIAGQISKPFSPPNLVRRVQTVLEETYGS